MTTSSTTSATHESAPGEPTHTSYRLGAHSIPARDVKTAAHQQLLAEAHRRHERVLCECTTAGAPMYVARVGSLLIVKRMPDTGMAHHRTCPSWQPPQELSGLGQVLGEAIDNDPDSGLTVVRVDFSLSKSSGRAAPAPAGAAAPDTVGTDGSKLTLRAMLHYLWDEAGFTTWSPRMAGRRQWRVVSWHLTQAARDKATKGMPLGSRLFVPAPFVADRKAELAAARMKAWAPARKKKGSTTTQLMMLIAEVKEIGPTRFGHKLVCKHLPDAPLMLADDIHRRMTTTFADELALWEGHDDAHLMVIATFSVGPTGLASAESLALMCTDSHWLPITNDYDLLLITKAVEEQRRFTVGLRYNLAADTPLATLTFTDTDPATAVYYNTAEDAAAHTDDFAELITAHGLAHWHWDTDAELPEFPAPTPPHTPSH